MSRHPKPEIVYVTMALLMLALVIGITMMESITGYSTNALSDITREDALHSINISSTYIDEMNSSGFSTLRARDMRTSALNALERADFAEIIRSSNDTGLIKRARTALEGIDYQGFSYGDVLIYTNEIANLKNKTYELYDSIRSLEMKITDYEMQGVNVYEPKRILNFSKSEFVAERYTSVEQNIDNANKILDENKSSMLSLSAIVEAGKSIIERYWKEIVAAVAILLLVFYVAQKRFRYALTRRKIRKLEAECESIKFLMKKAQEKRFMTGEISESVYTITMQKYEIRLERIKRMIPVLKSRLKKTKRNNNLILASL